MWWECRRKENPEKSHEETQHSSGEVEKSCKCDICPYETKDQSSLSKNTKRVHNEKPEKVKKSRDCSDCGKTFLRKDKFDNHVKVHNKNDAPLETCKDCDHKFTKIDDLERHVNTVHDRIKMVTSEAGFGTFVSNKKKWKCQNSFSAVIAPKHSTHLQTWKGTAG